MALILQVIVTSASLLKWALRLDVLGLAFIHHNQEGHLKEEEVRMKKLRLVIFTFDKIGQD